MHGFSTVSVHPEDIRLWLKTHPDPCIYASTFDALIPTSGELTAYPPSRVSLGAGSSYSIIPCAITITAAAGTDNWLYWDLPAPAKYLVFQTYIEAGGSSEYLGLGVMDANGNYSWIYFDTAATAADWVHEKVVGGVSTKSTVYAADATAGSMYLARMIFMSGDRLVGYFGAYSRVVDISGVGNFVSFFIRFKNASAAAATRGILTSDGGIPYDPSHTFWVFYKKA
jgi:hypothetical protein